MFWGPGSGADCMYIDHNLDEFFVTENISPVLAKEFVAKGLVRIHIVHTRSGPIYIY